MNLEDMKESMVQNNLVTMREVLKDCLFALLFSYLIFSIYILFIDGFSWATIQKTFFFFFLFARAPFLAAIKTVYALLPIVIALILLLLIFKKISFRYRKYVLVGLFLLWEIYGVMSLVYVSGGA